MIYVLEPKNWYVTNFELIEQENQEAISTFKKCKILNFI